MNFESIFKQERTEEMEEIVEGAESKVQFIKSLHDFVLSLDDEKASPMDSQQLETALRERFDSYVEGGEALKTALEKIEQEKTIKTELFVQQEQFKLIPRSKKTEDGPDPKICTLNLYNLLA